MVKEVKENELMLDLWEKYKRARVKYEFFGSDVIVVAELRFEALQQLEPKSQARKRAVFNGNGHLPVFLSADLSRGDLWENVDIDFLLGPKYRRSKKSKLLECRSELSMDGMIKKLRIDKIVPMCGFEQVHNQN